VRIFAYIVEREVIPVATSYKVAIDAGHGSNTAGKRTPPLPKDIDVNKDGKIDIKKGEQYREHYANVGVAYHLNRELQRCGFTTMRTGWDDDNAYNDPDTAIADRQKAIANAKCDYCISIHFNAYGDGKSFNSAEGFGVYIHDKYPGQSKKLAEIVLKHLAGGSKQKNRGVKTEALGMCNCNSLGVKAAIICELAFMTNEYEAVNLMANEVYWKECAQEICKGLCEFTGVKYVEETPEKKTIYRVQVGAFANKSNADKLVAELKKKGYDAIIVKAEK